MKHLNDNIPFGKPHLTVKELRDRTKINPVTLDRHLEKLEKRHIVIRYGYTRPEPGQKYKPDPRHPTFCRLNPETDGEIKWCMWPDMARQRQSDLNRKRKQRWYNDMRWRRKSGEAVRLSLSRGMLRVKKLLPANSH